MKLIERNAAQAEELGRELRQDSDTSLKCRRGVVGLSLTSIVSMGIIALYQIGILKHVPEPPFPGFDADKVNGSAQAYAYLSTPDAVFGLGNYATTLSLAAMGPANRAEKQPWVPIALAAKVGADAILAGKLTVDQWTKHRAFSFWCLLSAGSTLVALLLVLPEAHAALRELKQRID
ncbi:MAG TPA: vitamin K epoxide reductase family protein [Terriglobia bacterium]|nr:vitamin K epoxide reductase family protein [Terriglobia bacterium]